MISAKIGAIAAMPNRKSYLIVGPFVVWACSLGTIPALANPSVLERVVAEKAAILALMHKKAKKALVRAAQDTRFSAYFLAENAADRASLKRSIDQISLAVQRRFHVGEMCLIDQSGAEVSRITGDRIAYDLDKDESTQIFFAPSFDQRPRTAYVSPIYMSSDAAKWVVAYTSPIVVHGEKRAVLHYEHSLRVYQAALLKGTTVPGIYLQLVNRDGWIIGDSRVTIPIRMKSNSSRPGDYFRRFKFGGMEPASLNSLIDSADGAYRVARVRHADRTYLVSSKMVEQWRIFGFYPMTGRVVE